MGTIQEALKQLFYSLGGNADAVRNADDPAFIIMKMAALAIGEALKAELPAFPTDAGTYQLQVVIAEGEDPALSWEAVE